MPELPEVETTRKGIAPHLEGATIVNTVFRDRRLRWPISKNYSSHVLHQTVRLVTRRGKYIIISLTRGAMIIHLGMSGSLRLVDQSTRPEKHDHYDLVLDSGLMLRYRDPRRFGSLHWTKTNPLSHRLLKNLGPEPLSDQFTGDYLYQHSRNKKLKIKPFLMDSHIVPGIGNIYANEALFLGKIRPGLPSGQISKARYQQLVSSIKEVLSLAIQQGGTTLRDFVNSEGQPGYFRQRLFVYGRADEACRVCGSTIRSMVQNQRATFYCPDCQR